LGTPQNPSISKAQIGIENFGQISACGVQIPEWWAHLREQTPRDDPDTKVTTFLFLFFIFSGELL
jgi:hypothetical protein